MTPIRYWHGGAPGLKPGNLITPRPADDTSHLVDGCPTCEARKAGQQLAVDDNNPEWVYAAKTGQPNPAESRCACSCADAVRGVGS